MNIERKIHTTRIHCIGRTLKSFRKGDWDIDVIIRDDAGNEIVIEDIEFEVDY